MLGELTPEMRDELYGHILILHKPVYTFSECLTTYSKEDMIAIADELRYKVRRSKTKPVIAADFFEALSAQSRAQLSFQSKENIQLLKELMNGPKEINFLPFFKKNLDLFDLLDYRWVFLFYYEDTYTLVLPNETKEMLQKFIDDPAFQEENKKRNLHRDYVGAFMNLYGAFETSFFLEVWNQHNKQYPLEAHKLLQELIRLAWLGLDNRLRMTDDLEHIFDYSIIDEYEVPLFMSKSAHHEYYRPTETDIKYFAQHEFDERTPQYKKMKHYFSKKLNQEDFEDVMGMMMAHIKLDLGMKSLGRELDTQYDVVFDGEEDLSKFAELYKELNNHSRKWANRGQTPRETSKRSPNQTIIPEAGNTFMNNAPKQNQPIRVEKVGRNDPCPCGSVKKYKHCHGK